MPGNLTIDINLHDVDDSSAAKQAKEDKDTAEKKSGFIKAAKKLNILNTGSLFGVVEKATDSSLKSEKELAAMKAATNLNIGIMIAGAVLTTGWNATNTFTLSNISEKFGDQALQNDINNLKRGIGISAGLVGSIGAGAMLGGPVGAAIGAVTGVAAQAIKMIEAHAQWMRHEQENTYSEVRASERLGVDISQRSRSR